MSRANGDAADLPSGPAALQVKRRERRTVGGAHVPDEGGRRIRRRGRPQRGWRASRRAAPLRDCRHRQGVALATRHRLTGMSDCSRRGAGRLHHRVPPQRQRAQHHYSQQYKVARQRPAALRRLVTCHHSVLSSSSLLSRHPPTPSPAHGRGGGSPPTRMKHTHLKTFVRSRYNSSGPSVLSHWGTGTCHSTSYPTARRRR